MNWSDYQPYDQAQQLRELVRQERAATTALPTLSPERGKRTRVIAVTSGKGGVGKTNLVANLGIALANEGLRVGLFDADLGLANIDVLLGLVPRYSLAHVLSGERQIEEIMIPGPGGVMVLAGVSGMSSLADVPPENLERLIQSMDRLDGLLDICLVDTGAGIGRQVMSFVLVAEEVLVVTTPEPTAVTDAYGLIKTLRLNRSPAGIFLVVNMVEGQVEGQEIFNRLQMVSQRFLGVNMVYLGSIERDPCVGKAVRAQRPFLLAYPQSKASRSVRLLAEAIRCGSATQASSHSGLRGLWERLARLNGPVGGG